MQSTADVETGSIVAELGFASAEDVSVDTLRAGGVLRAKTHPLDGYESNALAKHPCRITDLARVEDPHGLESRGFESVDVSGLGALQRVLARVASRATLTDADARALRFALFGRSVRLSNGKRLRFLYVAPEGIILRKAGPNGVVVDPSERMTPTSGHGPAANVHADQDVRGTPVRQILAGAGPFVFRHEAPDGENRVSPLFLVNLWMPLQQITRPLALMDERTLDRTRHQLRYALPTESFLERDPDRRLNDIWGFLPDDAQRWYFTSEMDERRAYVFNTLSAPHGAFVVPGEEVAERYFVRLRDAAVAVRAGDASALRQAAAEVAVDQAAIATEPLRRAVAEMEATLAMARRDVQTTLGSGAAPFLARAERAMDRVVRKSVEVRTVALLTPSWCPF